MINQELLEITINSIKKNRNYRQTFNEKSLNELAQSIKENGVIEPIIVRRTAKGFELVAGERRLRASEIAGKVTIPAIVRMVSDNDFLKLQIVENMQRENVPYMEEARGVRKMRDDLSLDINEISKLIGKTDALIYNLLSLTKMSPEAQEIATRGELGKDVAIYISRLKTPEDQTQAAMDLRRTEKSKLVTGRTARQYLDDTFGANRVTRPQRNRIQKETGNDYQANWKKYLVRFSAAEFEQFKSIVSGRTETTVLAEAVEQICLGKSEAMVCGIS